MPSDQENTPANDEAEVQNVDESDVCDSPGDYLKRSDILATLQESFNNFSGAVQKRVNALKNLQLQVTNLEAQFYEEVHLLECKYNKLYDPIQEKRKTIISGAYEPNEEESEWKFDSMDAELVKKFDEKVKVQEVSEKKDEQKSDTTDEVGIPLFWLKTLKNVSIIEEMIQPCDEPILTHLTDVKTKLLEKDPMGFILEFYFSPNEFFTNSVLTKEYEMKCIPDPVDPFSFEGPEIVKCKGCKIDWKKGKNVTVKLVKKKQKHKSHSSVTRTVVKTVPNDSFFNFFSPPEVPEDSESENYEETQALLTNDFEIGHYIRERIVPNAVLYFTGEAMEDEFDEEEEEEEEEEDDVSEEEDSEDEAPEKNAKENANKKKGSRHSGSNTGGKTVATAGKSPADPSECKQQ